MIFGAFSEPLGPYLGAIWYPKWPPKRTLGPHGASRPSQMTPKSLLGPPRVVGVPKWGFSVPRNDSLSMVLRSCLWLTEKPGNPTPARGSSKMGPLSNTARHGNYNNYINRKLVKGSGSTLGYLVMTRDNKQQQQQQQQNLKNYNNPSKHNNITIHA